MLYRLFHVSLGKQKALIQKKAMTSEKTIAGWNVSMFDSSNHAIQVARCVAKRTPKLGAIRSMKILREIQFLNKPTLVT